MFILFSPQLVVPLYDKRLEWTSQLQDTLLRLLLED